MASVGDWVTIGPILDERCVWSTQIKALTGFDGVTYALVLSPIESNWFIPIDDLIVHGQMQYQKGQRVYAVRNQFSWTGPIESRHCSEDGFYYFVRDEVTGRHATFIESEMTALPE
jgi:hypothetical protein